MSTHKCREGVITVFTEAPSAHIVIEPPAKIIEIPKVIGPKGDEGPQGPPGDGFDYTTDFTIYYDLAKG